MMGKFRFAPKLYHELSVDRLVPQGHLLRQIFAAIEFSFIYPLARVYYGRTGQLLVDSIVLFKTLLASFLYSITSELTVEERFSQYGLQMVSSVMIWMKPSLTIVFFPKPGIVLEWAGLLENFFKHSAELCQEAGLLSEGPVCVDTTFVQAAASMDSRRERDENIKPPLPIREYVYRLYTENAPPPQEELVPCPPPPAITQLSDSDGRVSPRYRAIRPMAVAAKLTMNW